MRFFPLVTAVFGLLLAASCAPKAVLFADPETRKAAPGLLRAWNSPLLGERRTIEVDQPVFDAEKYLKSRSEVPQILVTGSWADRGLLDRWVHQMPQTRFCVILPRENLPGGVTALAPDRRSGWKALAVYAAQKFNVSADRPPGAVFTPRTPPELQEVLRNTWAELKPGIPLLVVISDQKNGINTEAVRTQLPPRPGFLFILADRDTPALLSELGQKVPIAVEFPPEDLPNLWTVGLVLDEDRTEKLFSEQAFPGNKKEIFLPLKIRESVR